MIRRLAGLPADSAKGEIEIIDVGRQAMDTMLSIVRKHTDAGWRVSYACAMSPHCAPSADHASNYRLSAAANAEVDALLAKLMTGGEPDGQLPSPNFLSGNLLFSIDYQGLKHDYRRAGVWGQTLGRLEALLKPTTAGE